MWKLILIKPLGPAAICRKYRGQKFSSAGLCQENACGKIETVGTNRTNGPGFSTDKPYKETNTCNKETSETQRSHFSKSQDSFWREGGAGVGRTRGEPSGVFGKVLVLGLSSGHKVFTL